MGLFFQLALVASLLAIEYPCQKTIPDYSLPTRFSSVIWNNGQRNPMVFFMQGL